jgi:hypothetical protein
MLCRVHVLSHSSLLFCECGILGISFAKLASDSRAARNADDRALLKDLAQETTLTIVSCTFTFITFALTILGTHVMSRMWQPKSPTFFGSIKHTADLVSTWGAKRSSTVADEPARA